MILPNHDRYREYTDEELEGWLKGYPHHADQALVFRELDIRQKIRDQVATNDRELNRDRQDEKRHKENQTLGQKTLFWAKIGGIAGVIATIVLLLKDTPLSKPLLSTSSRASPTPFQQASATAAPLGEPTATEPPSATPQASATPAQTTPPQ